MHPVRVYSTNTKPPMVVYQIWIFLSLNDTFLSPSDSGLKSFFNQVGLVSSNSSNEWKVLMLSVILINHKSRRLTLPWVVDARQRNPSLMRLMDFSIRTSDTTPNTVYTRSIWTLMWMKLPSMVRHVRPGKN